jgi:hypothetical protein
MSLKEGSRGFGSIAGSRSALAMRSTFLVVSSTAGEIYPTRRRRCWWWCLCGWGRFFSRSRPTDSDWGAGCAGAPLILSAWSRSHMRVAIGLAVPRTTQPQTYLSVDREPRR